MAFSHGDQATRAEECKSNANGEKNIIVINILI